MLISFVYSQSFPLVKKLQTPSAHSVFFKNQCASQRFQLLAKSQRDFRLTTDCLRHWRCSLLFTPSWRRTKTFNHYLRANQETAKLSRKAGRQTSRGSRHSPSVFWLLRSDFIELVVKKFSNHSKTKMPADYSGRRLWARPLNFWIGSEVKQLSMSMLERISALSP